MECFTDKKPTRALFRYFGGKQKLASWIVSYFPEHTRYIEPYCGAASVFFRKPRVYAEMLNDIDGEIYNVYKVLREDSFQLRHWLDLTPYSRAEYDAAFEIADNPIERARRFFVRTAQGYYADSANINSHKAGFRDDIKRGRTIPAHDWGKLPPILDFFITRLRGIVLENKPALKIIDKYKNNPDCLFYLDPPYVAAERKTIDLHQYANEMTDAQHCELIALLHEIKGSVVLSGYKTQLYAPLESSGWRRVEREVKNNTWTESRIECLWLNSKAQEKAI